MGNLQPAVDDGRRDIDDLMFEILTASARRTILRQLANCPRPLTGEELIGGLVMEATETEVERIGDERRMAIAIAFKHVHLPKLVEARLVEYEPESDRVELSSLGLRLAGTRPKAWSSFDISFAGADASSTEEELT